MGVTALRRPLGVLHGVARSACRPQERRRGEDVCAEGYDSGVIRRIVWRASWRRHGSLEGAFTGGTWSSRWRSTGVLGVNAAVLGSVRWGSSGEVPDDGVLTSWGCTRRYRGPYGGGTRRYWGPYGGGTRRYWGPYGGGTRRYWGPYGGVTRRYWGPYGGGTRRYWRTVQWGSTGMHGGTGVSP